MPGHFSPRFMTSSKPLRGVCLILAAVFFFALLDATTKQLAKTYPVTFIAWARYLLHGLLMAVILGPRMGRRLVLTARPGLNVLRSLMLVGTTCFAIAAFRTMPLAETSSVINISPLLVAFWPVPGSGKRWIGATGWPLPPASWGCCSSPCPPVTAPPNSMPWA